MQSNAKDICLNRCGAGGAEELWIAFLLLLQLLSLSLFNCMCYILLYKCKQLQRIKICKPNISVWTGAELDGLRSVVGNKERQIAQLDQLMNQLNTRLQKVRKDDLWVGMNYVSEWCSGRGSELSALRISFLTIVR